MQHERIIAAGTFGEDDPEVLRAITDAKPIVRQLAHERAKKWPTSPNLQVVHKERIGSLESELGRIASRLNGLSIAALEAATRREIDKSGRSKLPEAVTPPPSDNTARVLTSDVQTLEVELEAVRRSAKISQERHLAKIARVNDQLRAARVALAAHLNRKAA